MAKVIFVQNISYPFIGLMQISALLKQGGHECEAVISETHGSALEIIRQENPDIIGFSIMTGSHQWGLALSRQIKQILPSAVIVWGGPHPTFMPETINEEGIDVLCRGEGDHAMLELAEAVEHGIPYDNIPNLWVKGNNNEIIRNDLRPLIQDLDTLPFPDRSLYRRNPEIASASTQIFISSRGCPFDCTFCFNHRLKDIYRRGGNFVRHRSVHNLIDEISVVAESMTVKTVYFNDDTFVLDRTWVEEFAESYAKRVRIPFICLARADMITEELAALLARAGCSAVFFGIETGSERLRNELLKKRVTDDQIASAARSLKRHGIRFRTYNLLGLPGETLQDAFETVRINIRIGTDFPWAALFTPYPGTELGDRCRETGLLDHDFTVDSLEGTFHSGTLLNLPHRREIVNLHRFFQTAVLMPWTFPIIRRIISWPQNRFFTVWFSLVYGYVYIRSERRGWIRTALFGLKNLRHLSPAIFSKARA